MACDGCHTPRPPGGALDMSKRFSGGSQTWDTPRYLVKGTNISPDPETGIGKWSADDFKRALIEGVRPSGVALAPANAVRLLQGADAKGPRRGDRLRAFGHTGTQRGAAACLSSAEPCRTHSWRGKTHERGGAARSGFEARLLSRNYRPLHGMPRAAPGWYAGLRYVVG